MRLAVVTLRTDADVARLRQAGLAAAREAGFATFAQTRIVTALVELGRHAIRGDGEGRMTLSLSAEGDRAALRAVVAGGGAEAGPAAEGAGLAGVRRIADRFELRDDADGALATALFVTDHPAEAIRDLAARIGAAIAAQSQVDPAAALAQQNQELMLALSERDLLLQEVHHRTRNNLTLVDSLIRLSARSAQHPETKQALADLGMRVQAVVGAHEQMERSEGAERLALVPFLRGIAGRVRAAFSTAGAEVSITVEGALVEVEAPLAVDLGLIVGELLTNALKHAFAGRESGTITISVAEDARSGELVLEVRDDGPGLPPGMSKPSRASSLGWRVVEAMAARHGGRIEVASGQGLRVRVLLERAAGE